ncbi:PIN domain-containing protein [Lacipirellula limnantheis]|uniref:PIN domain-containing protein n=1 Tax=Lacipirellula limnantheis TaxID=2528024 RepID=A0A517TRG9_9BACT|nr:PIN domain-containing protein [Lacipirellula limnantheis]QDT70971.1 hypothetical protein I41_01260 [Lacipirellula limnantheis]
MGVTLFFDTMMYLHYRPLNEIDLCAHFGADSVKIVVAMVTIEELDKHKSDNRDRKRQHRARVALNMIKTHAMQGDPIRIGVTMEIFRVYPFDYDSHRLNEHKNDDVLVASVIGYRSAHPEENVFLVSEDVGPQITAHLHHIPQATLGDQYRLPTQPDESELELARLRKEIAELKNAIPKPCVYFRDSGVAESHKVFHISTPAPFDESGAEDKLAALARQHPEFPRTEAVGFNYLDPSTVIIPSAFPEKFNRARNDYLSRYRDYLVASHSAAVRRTLSLLVELRIKNSGSTPARDLSLELRFPKDLQIYTADAFPWGPAEPTLPKILDGPDLGRQGWELIADSVCHNAARMAAATRPTLEIDANIAHFTTAYLKHGEEVAVPPLYVLFESLEQAHSFHCDYEFKVGNLPKPVSGRLQLVVEKLERMDGPRPIL